MSPWKLALPALIIGPVTYLVCVWLLFRKVNAPSRHQPTPDHCCWVSADHG